MDMKCEFCGRKLYTIGEYRHHLRVLHVEEMAMDVARRAPE